MKPPTGRPVGAPMSLTMSPSQAAQASGTSRRSVMRAIETQELQAFRDNRNHWKITPQALEEWASAQGAPSEQLPTPAHPLPTLEDTAEWRADREARRLAEVEAAELRGRLLATEAERDRLLDIVQRLTAPTTAAPRRRWWPF